MDWNTGFDNAFSDVLTKRNLRLLVLFWSVGVVLVISYGTVSGRLWGLPACSTDTTPTLTGNETGSFEVYRDATEAGCPGAYKVACDNLRVGDATTGIFKRASHKVVHIENLDVTFRRPLAGNHVRWQDFCDLFAPECDGGAPTRSLGILKEIEAQTADWSIPVDLSDATEVRVRDLDWQVCCGGRTVLRVTCKYALLRATPSRVILRGHAKVTTPQATLQSNHIEMNVRDECLAVNGRYVVTRGRCRQTGSAACFDKMLRPLSVARSEIRENEKWAKGL
jgi:hypothetical protein